MVSSACRAHGGAHGSGAPSGERNGNYRHGFYTAERLPSGKPPALGYGRSEAQRDDLRVCLSAVGGEADLARLSRRPHQEQMSVIVPYQPYG